MRVLWLVAAIVMAGCAQPAESDLEPFGAPPAMDLMAIGPFESSSQTWENSVTIVTGASPNGVPIGVYPVELRGTLHVPDTEAPAPILLFMHGRHSTCNIAQVTEFLAPAGCPDAPPVTEPVRNARGYEYLGDFLASHGFVVISVNANNVNDNDLTWSLAGDDSGATARAAIIGKVLRDLDAANQGTQVGDWPELAGRLDLGAVGLMGHSRGGEGVVAANSLANRGELNIGSAQIRAVFALAPTDFAHWEITDTAFATLLPYCDGDVSNLQGAWMYDENRHKRHDGFYQFTVLGANHNFYNTIWLNDDFGNRGDPWCDLDGAESGRLTPEEQQANGIMLMASFFRAHVGMDTTLLPFLQGQVPWPAAGTLTSYHPAGARQSFAFTASSNVDIATCASSECPGQLAFPAASQTRMSWSADGTLSIPDDVTTARFNIIPGSDAGTRVFITGPAGSYSLAELGALVPPGNEYARSTLNMIVLPEGQGRTLEFVGSGELLSSDWL